MSQALGMSSVVWPQRRAPGAPRDMAQKTVLTSPLALCAGPDTDMQHVESPVSEARQVSTGKRAHFQTHLRSQVVGTRERQPSRWVTVAVVRAPPGEIACQFCPLQVP